jgi:8-oxo-dGTP pyrophosphatase MutT (NUDIX family)
MGEAEFARLKSSQKHGRKHDITMFIRRAGKIVVIAKHFYPPGLYRAPSGGIVPGEDFVEGAMREAGEETGCEIELVRYLMRIGVIFWNENSDEVGWVSHVFSADSNGGELRQRDTAEIREVRLAGLDDFDRYNKFMLHSELGGFHYRAFLQDEVLKNFNILDSH